MPCPLSIARNTSITSSDIELALPRSAKIERYQQVMPREVWFTEGLLLAGNCPIRQLAFYQP